MKVTRWTRHGHDRLYVKSSDGKPVGWQCLRTGAVTVEQESLRSTMLAALADHPAAVVPDGPAPPLPRAVPVIPVQAVEPSGAFPAWTDLAGNLPGQGLLAEAAALRAARPWRCRIARLLNVHTEERAKRVGAKGEQLVAARLTKLPEGWRTLHAIVRSESGTDVDHLVIGPAGVFTINSKYHRGKRVWVRGSTVKVNGHNQTYVRDMRSEVTIVARLLSSAVGRPVPVRGVVAIICQDFARKGDDDCDVKVIGRKDLAAWLQRQPTDRLTPAQVSLIFERARRSTSWLPTLE